MCGIGTAALRHDKMYVRPDRRYLRLMPGVDLLTPSVEGQAILVEHWLFWFGLDQGCEQH
jgi:hypothetical protein